MWGHLLNVSFLSASELIKGLFSSSRNDGSSSLALCPTADAIAKAGILRLCPLSSWTTLAATSLKVDSDRHIVTVLH